MTILVIEDEALLLNEVIEWLTFEGYETVGAADGQAGITYATFYQPQLILCDIMLPHLDGYHVLAAVRAHNTTANVPFIFMTARAGHGDVRKGMELGADDYITKPFTRLELLNAVAARLVKREQEHQEYAQEMQHLQNALVQLHNRHILQGKLLSMLSHDFSGPLTSILLTTTLLQTHDSKLESQARQQYLERIAASVRLLQQMLEDTRLVTQIERGTITLQPEEIVPSEFLARILSVFRATYGDKYQVALDCGVDAPVTVDVRLLRQIAMNLIGNAMKYSAAGSTVHVTLVGEGESIHLIVQDTGIGIPPADQNRIFESFQRGSNVASITGSGLGLAIVKQAIDLLQGSVALESELGVGTTVTVVLPQTILPT
jgi:signal transduction histidine kinase